MIDGTFVRVLSWYDNEWGFSNRMARHRDRAGEADLKVREPQSQCGRRWRLRKGFPKSFPRVGRSLLLREKGCGRRLAPRPAFLQVAALACMRRAHIERRLSEQLEKAAKPIEITKSATS